MNRAMLAMVSTAFLLVNAYPQQQVGTGAQQHITTDAQAQAAIEANTNVIESTFKVVGNNVTGSGFILARPYTQAGRQHYRHVLVTAAHMLTLNEGEFVTVWFRRRTANGTWEQLPTQVMIRNGATPLWQQHPRADVAVIYVTVPDGVLPGDGISTDTLADDVTLRSYGIHPGDEVRCDGFPLSVGGPFGFPILRTGRIASYPILPSAETKTFLLDFPVFPGNSGGPAYIAYDAFRNTGDGKFVAYGGNKLTIVGLVSGEKIVANRIPLGIAEIVHATLISETIAQLPPPEHQ